MALISTGRVLKAEPQSDGKLLVIARATSETVDKQGEMVEYQGALKAFSVWPGNIREMHDETKAVGKAVEVMPNDADKAIDVKFFVSAGAKDTQEKVLDGTLSAVSIGGDVAENGRVTKNIDGQKVTVLTDWRLVELSLVDNPANPDCVAQIVKADGPTDVVAEPEAEPNGSGAPEESPEEEGAEVSPLKVARAALVAFLQMEAKELDEESVADVMAVADLIRQVEMLMGKEQMEAVVESMEMSDKVKDVLKGMISAEMDKQAMGKLTELADTCKELADKVAAIGAECKAMVEQFGDGPSEADPKEEEKPSDEVPADEQKADVVNVTKAMTTTVESILKGALGGFEKSLGEMAREIADLKSKPAFGGPVRAYPVTKSLAVNGTPEPAADDPVAVMERVISALPEEQRNVTRQAMALELHRANLSRR